MYFIHSERKISICDEKNQAKRLSIQKFDVPLHPLFAPKGAEHYFFNH